MATSDRLRLPLPADLFTAEDPDEHHLLQPRNRVPRPSLEHQLRNLTIAPTLPNFRDPEFINNDLPQSSNRRGLLNKRIESAARGDPLPLSYMPYKISPGNSSSPVVRNVHGYGNLGGSGVDNVSDSGRGAIFDAMAWVLGSSSSSRRNVLRMATSADEVHVLCETMSRRNPDVVQAIFDELRDGFLDLMMHPVGSIAIQRLLEVCTHQQMSELIDRVFNSKSKFVEICMDPIWNKMVQKLLDSLQISQQRRTIVMILSHGVVDLTKNANSHNVIVHFMQNFTPSEIKPFIYAMVRRCYDVSSTKHGCIIVKKILRYTTRESKELLMNAIAVNALDLSLNCYGNFVVQYVLKLDKPHETEKIVAALSGKFLILSNDKYASNVVQTCLISVEPTLYNVIFNELVDSDGILSVMLHPFGNYVAQTLLETAKGYNKLFMVNCVSQKFSLLKGHPFGNQVLQKALTLKRLQSIERDDFRL